MPLKDYGDRAPGWPVDPDLLAFAAAPASEAAAPSPAMRRHFGDDAV